MDDDSNDESNLVDDFFSTDESDLEYVEKASVEPESVETKGEQHQKIDIVINKELDKQAPQSETDEEVVLWNNSNIDQSDIGENCHAGRYSVHEIPRKRAHVRGGNRASPAPRELQRGGIRCRGGQQRRDGFDDGHAQQVRHGVQQGSCGRQATHGGGRGLGQGIQHDVNRNQVDTSWIWDTECETDVASDPSLFLEVSGLKKHMNSQMTIDFFQLHLTDELFQFLVTETNQYASQFIVEREGNNGSDDSYVGTWEDTTIVEMKRFIGLLILMEIVYKPTIPVYWSTSELHNTPIFSKVMPRTRFQLLLKFLHFNNNDLPDPKDENRDRLYKLRPLIDILKK